MCISPLVVGQRAARRDAEFAVADGGIQRRSRRSRFAEPGAFVSPAHSGSGPIKPQVSGAPAHRIREEFEKATQAFKDNPSAAQVWIPILQKYTPTPLGECDNAIKMAGKIVSDWLDTGILKGDKDCEKHPEAKERSAVIYTLLGGCRRHGINPFDYMKDLFTRLPAAKTTQIREFTPAVWPSANNSYSQRGFMAACSPLSPSPPPC